MSASVTSQDLIARMEMTRSEISVAERAAKLIRKYRLESGGTWSGLTADELVRDEVKDPLRQISVLSLACLVEKETRTPSSSPDSGDG